MLAATAALAAVALAAPAAKAPAAVASSSDSYGSTVVATDCPGVSANASSPSATGLQLCVDGCLHDESCGELYFPAGDYLLQHQIVFNTTGLAARSLRIRGEGKATRLLWPADDDLLVWLGPANQLTVDAFTVSSTGHKSPNSTAIRFLGPSVTQSLFDALIVNGVAPYGPGSGLDLSPLTDSCTVREVQLWGVTGTGIKIGKGSQVIIKGGRVIGNGPTPRGTSTGIHVTGGNGGVHVAQTDVIAHLEALRLDASSGAGSNREIFIAQATLDSSWRNLAVYDNSYVDVAGCWTASAEDTNVYISPESTGSLLSITGGTIFNACAEQPNATAAGGGCNGMQVHSGSFTLTGVSVRNNRGTGIFTGDKCSGYSITGCKIYGNAVGAELRGDNFTLVANVFGENGAQLNASGSGGAIANNVGLPAAER